MKKVFIVLGIIFLAGVITVFIGNKENKNNLVITNDKLKTTKIDTAKYEEVRYVSAPHFTSSGLYNLHCKFCHGNDGTSSGVIARYHKDQYCPYDLSKVTKPDTGVYYVILKGKEHMPDASKPVAKHVLTNDDIWLIVYYIKKFKEDE